MSSFFTERTAEYAILPPLLAYLRQRFGAAVPMYFWATREGNSVAQERHSGRRFRVLVVFARRPKVLDGHHMLGKINRELFEFADRAGKHRIPSVAAFPAVSDLFELGRDFQTYWFPLAGLPHQDAVFKVSLSRPDLRPEPLDGFRLEPWELEDVGDAVEVAPVLTWRDAVCAIRDVRHAHRIVPDMGFIGGGSSYMPVYVLVPE
ncbi:hypothetical protein ACTJKJ_20500 [Roseateles sp. 22389]|uniref:hypothetical protein n=1 Tax=Roseateles sp. 22389 TaxID=3453916 RepID=UPI003F82BCDE